MTAIARTFPFVLAVALTAGACASAGTPIRSAQPLRSHPTSCISGIGADTTVYSITDIDEKPVFRRAFLLTYPREALRNKIQGRVVVTAIVNSGGNIDQSSVAVVRRVHPLLDDEARQIVSSATLWPACRNGHPVRMRMEVPFDFQVRRPFIAVWQAVSLVLVGGIIGGVLGQAR